MNYVYRFMHEGKEMSTTPLIQAACFGHANVVSALIEKGAELVEKGANNKLLLFRWQPSMVIRRLWIT